MVGISSDKEEATDNLSIHQKKGLVTVSVHRLSDDLAPGTENSILKQAGLK